MNEQPIFSPTPRRPFSVEEKVALVLLIMTGVGGLFFGFRYLSKNVQSPFTFNYSGSKYLSTSEQETARINQLKARDTDSDTLNDYDELYVYKTSPYLADSDSDGYNDATELASGNDPNCPQGKTCGGVAAVDTTTDASDALLQGLTPPTAPDLQGSGLDQAAGVDAQSVIDQMTPEQLRELLIANGANETQVKALSDDELMKLYEEALSQSSASQQTP